MAGRGVCAAKGQVFRFIGLDLTPFTLVPESSSKLVNGSNRTQASSTPPERPDVDDQLKAT